MSLIAITATGIISALGTGMEAQFAALKAGNSGLALPQILTTNHQEFPIGEVKSSNEALLTGLGNPSGDLTRTSLLALHAARDLATQLPSDFFQNRSTALISAGTVGGMCTVEDYYLQFLQPEGDGSYHRWADSLSCAQSTRHVSDYLGFEPVQSATLSTACSSSVNALILGARMLLLRMADAAICGGVDSMSRFTLNGFNALKNLDREHCKPFDEHRAGLNLGEAAAFVMLERAEDAQARGAHILGYLAGWANGNDTYHPTAPSPDGSAALRTMQAALSRAGIAPEQVDYINAHGTATHTNDVSEGRAIQDLFGNKVPFSSTKPFTGHTLAAAGAVECVLCLACMIAGYIPPNLNFSTPMQELSITPQTEGVHKELEYVVSNSFGFGGSNVSLVLKKS